VGEASTPCLVRRKRIGRRSRNCGSGGVGRARKACRHARSSSQATPRPGPRRAMLRRKASAALAHPGHMKLENPHEDSWSPTPQGCPETPINSKGREDSWRLLKVRACPAGSLPRRRSPVRIWCSAPNRPESARLAVPGFFMGVAFRGDAVCSQRLGGTGRTAKHSLRLRVLEVRRGPGSVDAWHTGGTFAAGFQTAARQDSVREESTIWQARILFAGRAGLVARGTIANRERANALVQDAAMTSATRCLAGPKRKRVSVQRHCAARCTRRLRK
jgi:hypothetical protein